MRTNLTSAVIAVAVAFACVAPGCATYEQELQRSEEHFTHDEHEQALAGLRALEPDWASFDARDRARYCYLRGMTDYRIGFKADARHWLAIAAEINVETPGSLVPSEASLVNDKLAELNQVIWTGDVLAIEEPPGTHTPKKVETTKSDEGGGEAKPTDDGSDKTDKKKPSDDDDSPKPKPKKKKDE